VASKTSAGSPALAKVMARITADHILNIGGGAGIVCGAALFAAEAEAPTPLPESLGTTTD